MIIYMYEYSDWRGALEAVVYFTEDALDVFRQCFQSRTRQG